MTYEQLKKAAKAEFVKTSSMPWEMFNAGTDLRNCGTSEFETLEDVPLNKKVATLYAIEVLRSDDTRVIYVGTYSKSLMCRPGTGIKIDHGFNPGIVVAIKNLWDGKIVKFGDDDYSPFVAFAGTE